MRVAYNNENKTWPGFVVEDGKMLKWPPVSAKTGHSLISRDWEVLDSFFRHSAVSGTKFPEKSLLLVESPTCGFTLKNHKTLC